MRYKFNTVIQYAMVEVCALRVELYCRGRFYMYSFYKIISYMIL